MKKTKVCILCGGKSAEHEVSLQSAKNVYDAIDKNKYDPVLVGIDKNGNWLLEGSDFLINAHDPKNIRLNPNGLPVVLVKGSGEEGRLVSLSGTKETFDIDVVFPILHGPCGEDGTVQGLLKLAGIPFSGGGVLGSAVGMDKDVMKKLLAFDDIPICKHIVITRQNGEGQLQEYIPPYDEIKNKLGEPCFVKPANMGSSVGVEKIHNEAEYKKYVNLAFQYDTKIILEEFIKGREIECAVLGNEDPVASVPGEVKSSHEFYSYDAKYLDENGAAIIIPAKIDANTTKQIQDLAVKTFKALYASGLSRVDFFLTDAGKIYVNEINTMPGFTKISMYPKLWEASGISYTKLIDRLIELAFECYKKENSLNTSYLNSSC
ncbi:MAG: D-alanine--D-alanine ligase [Termitinemataceae bacterium]|nr:MAG: D-alanine--D-alanine ligase [Termitinemataceae bacterium]